MQLKIKNLSSLYSDSSDLTGPCAFNLRKLGPGLGTEGAATPVLANLLIPVIVVGLHYFNELV